MKEPWIPGRIEKPVGTPTTLKDSTMTAPERGMLSRNGAFAALLLSFLMTLVYSSVGLASGFSIFGAPDSDSGMSTDGFGHDSVDSRRESKSDFNDLLVDPITAPMTFETPVAHTSVNPMYIYHRLPSKSIFGGGNIQIWATQVRIAVTERLSLIATKDGHIDSNGEATPDERGYADLAGGFKYAVIHDPDRGFILTPGLTYELTNGSRDVFQGNGEGLWRPFVSAGLDLDRWNLIAAFAMSLPVDGDAESQSVDYHFHASYELTDSIIPVLEVNGISYTNNGRRLAANFEGADLANLGSNNVDGNDLITGALGLRLKLGSSVQLGVAYEENLTSRKDIFESRVTVDALFKF